MSEYEASGRVVRGRRLVQHAALLIYADRPLHKFLAQLARILKRALSAEQFFVGLRAPDGSLRLEYGGTHPGERRARTAREVFETGKPALIRDPPEMYAPVRYAGTTMGVATVISAGTAYSQDDLRLLESVTDYIGIAVSNQDLVRSVLRPYRRLQRAAVVLAVVATILSLAFIALSVLRGHHLAELAVTQARMEVNAAGFHLQNYVSDAAQLSRSIAALGANLRGDRARTEQVLTEMLGSAPKETIYGAGLWYAPYAFDRRTRLYGPYVHRVPKDTGHIVVTYFWSSPKYDYPSQPWYKFARSAPRTVFTKPYFDTDLTYVTSAQSFHDASGTFLGVATVGMTVPFLQRFIASQSRSPEQIAYLTTLNNTPIVFPYSSDLLAFDRRAGGHARAISEVSVPTLQKYLASRFNGPRVDTAVYIPLVNWNLHESQLARKVYDAAVGMWFWTAGAIVALWICTTLGIKAILRSREDMLERIRIELEHSRLRNEVDQRLQAEQRLREATERDLLTGLPTRIATLDAISAALGETRVSGGARFAVLFIDLDHFNAVNDAIGHAAGDEVLRAIAGRLRECCPQGVVGRYGGDEFVILTELDKEGQGAVNVADCVLSALGEPFTIGNHKVFVRASIGITLMDDTYHSAEDVVSDADVAMYRAKSKGTLRFETFDAQLREEAATRVRIESLLRAGLSRGAFFVEYQPIIRFDGNEIRGFEALVRSRTDNGTVMYPQDFVETAERTGMMPAIDAKVLAIVREDVRTWNSDRSERYVAVNVSALHFATRGMAQELIGKIDALDFPPGSLHLEITETALLGDREVAAEAIAALGGRRISISIDDFGTGYSSLAYVELFNVDTLKIDKSFIETFSQRPHAAEIVRAIYSLGQALDMLVIAEGIETIQQLRLVWASGVQYGQGFLFSKPVQADKVRAMLREPVLRVP